MSDQPASAAAVFTTNRVQAAPVRIAAQHLRASRGRVSAILVNAGNANCATRTGDEVALDCCRAVAKHLKVPVAQILPASTGRHRCGDGREPDRERAAAVCSRTCSRAASQMSRTR